MQTSKPRCCSCSSWFGVFFAVHPATLLGNQMDEEVGYGSIPVLTRQPAAVANDSNSDADLVNLVSSSAPFCSLIKATVTIACSIACIFILQTAIYEKSWRSLIIAIISFIGCFFCTILALGSSVICHIPAMLFAAKVCNIILCISNNASG